ncbi:MAG: hemin uptake protein HemP [Sulfuricurvum sp.]|jgi:hemin uptake protein HemP
MDTKDQKKQECKSELVSSTLILGEAKSICILHNNSIYTLRVTKENKLILTK